MNPYGDNYPGTDALAGLTGGVLACYFLFVFAVVAFMIYVYWRILTKAGYSGWLSLLNLVPLGTLVLMMILAFGNWPAMQQRSYAAPAYPQVAPPQYPPTQQQPAPPAYQPPAQQPPAYQPPTQPPMYQPPGEQPPAPPAPPAPPE